MKTLKSCVINEREESEGIFSVFCKEWGGLFKNI